MAGLSDGAEEFVAEVASVGAAIQNATFSEGSQLGPFADHTLWIFSRIAAFLVLVLAIAAVVVVCHLKRFTASTPRTPEPFRPFRMWHKVKSCLYNSCCCVYCCPSAHAAVSPDFLRPVAPRTLRVTLLRAEGLRRRSSFYLEVSTKPAEGWPKISRVQNQVVGSCDLAGETLDLDWYGDEEGVVITVVEYYGSQVSKDRPLGELHLSRDTVAHYAAEAAGTYDLSMGSRLFPVKPLGSDSERARSGRFQGPKPAILQPFLPGVISWLQDQSTSDETAHLRDEVKRLRAENEALGGTSHRTAITTQRSEESETVMRVAIRFSIVATARAGTQLYRQPSFEEKMPLVATGPSCCV